MLINKSSLGLTCSLTGSLSRSWPAAITAVFCPWKLRDLSVCGAAWAPDSSIATEAAPTCRGVVPNTFVKRTRTSEPATLEETTSRTVWLLTPLGPGHTESGEMPVSPRFAKAICGEAPQPATHLPGAAATADTAVHSKTAQQTLRPTNRRRISILLLRLLWKL